MDKHEIYEMLDKVYFSDQMDEKEVIDHLPQLLRSARLFVDIGASLGQYTYFANQLMTAGQIVAIEADPIRFEKLESNCHTWSTSSSNTLKCLQGAVSDSGGKISFFITGSDVSGGLFKHGLEHVSNEAKKRVGWSEIEVDSFTLDSLFQNTIPDCVKIDVEGSELRVLRGGENILGRGKTIFLVELHDFLDPDGQRNPSEVIQYMKQFGYSHYNFYGKRLFVKNIRRRLPLLYFRWKLFALASVSRRAIVKLRKIFLA
jgi:FkbM family methyltransferase